MTNAPIDPGVRIGHVHLKVADLDRALNFYCGVLGFEPMQRVRGAAFISAGGYHHHIGLNTWESGGGSPPPLGSTGLYHVAILYPTRAATRRRAAPAHRSQDSARRRFGPRRQRGALSARSRRQWRRALLGPAEGTVAARRRWQARDVHAPARSGGAVARSRECAAAANGRCAVRSRFLSQLSPGACAWMASAWTRRLELVRQRRIDHAVAFEPALPAEGFRYDIEPVMALAARPVSGMSFMQMRLVFDMQALRREGRQQFCRNDVLHSHGGWLS